MKKTLSIYLLLFLTFSISSCDKDDEPEDPVIPNEEELITTLIYRLTPDAGDDIVFTFQDLDGDGGNDPVLIEGTLSANTVYTGAIVLLNETEDPAENITEEVEEEAEDHQFFYSSTLTDLSVAYTDTDADGNPVGLTTSLTTGNPGMGVLTILLRHEPLKEGTGVSDGDITNAGGETDIEVDFNINVE